MTRLPRVSGRDCVAALLKAGFQFKRQHGSHIILRRDSPFAQVVVPDHSELDTGTLRSILRQSGVSPEEFLKLLS
jgi:predicted RNA binding protein YcfA (HicA-like mRNA interferase family)